MLRFSVLVRLSVLALATVLVAGSVCEAQQREGRRGPRGGGFRGAGGITEGALLRAEAVQKELGLTDAQNSQIEQIVREAGEKRRELFSGVRDLPEEERRQRFRELREKGQQLSQETDKQINAVLNESQQKRLGEIQLQVRGTSAIADRSVAEKLGLSDEQRQQIRDLVTSQREMQQELFSGLRELSREERQAKMAEIRTKTQELRSETDKALLETLTSSQQEQWAALQGEAFEFDRGELFRGGFRFGGRRRGGAEGGERRRREGRERSRD